MHASIRLTALALLAHAGTLSAQSGGVMADLLSDIKEVEEKLVGLAKAMPEASWNWRPGTGVRSVGEVFQHVAADNYLLPAMLGTAPPAATGIVGTDYKTVQAYETRKVDRATVVADLEASFAHLKKAMQAQQASALAEEKTFFGRKSTTQQVWILTTTHLHEHLGQAIAYARSNNVKPPWSN